MAGVGPGPGWADGGRNAAGRGDNGGDAEGATMGPKVALEKMSGRQSVSISKAGATHRK